MAVFQDRTPKSSWQELRMLLPFIGRGLVRDAQDNVSSVNEAQNDFPRGIFLISAIQSVLSELPAGRTLSLPDSCSYPLLPA